MADLEEQSKEKLIISLQRQIEDLKSENKFLRNQLYENSSGNKSTEVKHELLSPQCKILLGYFPDGISILNHELQFLYVNQSFELLAGRTKTELLLQDIPADLFSESAIPVSKILQDAIKSGKEKDFYFTIHQNGIAYYYSKIVPIEVDENTPPNLLVICRDITNLKKFELSLLRSEHNWKRLVNNLPDTIVRVDKNLRFTFVNETMLKTLELSQEDLLGRNSEEITSEISSDAPVFAEQIKKVFDRKDVVNFCNYFGKKDNQKFFYVSLVPEFSADGNTVESVVGITRDISEVQQSRIKIENQNKELKRINEYLDNFVHIMAHDFRGPLTILSLLKDQIRECEDEEMREEFFNMLSRAVNQLNTQLTSLIEMIKLEAGQAEPAEFCNLDEMVSFVNKKLKDDLQGHEIEIETDFSAAPTIFYPPSHLECIIRNMLNNSIKHRDQNRNAVISIKSVAKDDQIEILYQDNSKGFNLKNKLSARPTQSDGKISSNELGLFILKNIIERNGGSISIESELKKGTLFKIHIQQS